MRSLIHRLISYPILSPIILGYQYTKDPRLLDIFYSIRSLLHGLPLANNLRLARYAGNWLIFPSREDPNIDDVYLRNVYHVYKPKSKDVVIDVGAHMGFFTTKLARHVKTVLSFEPDPFNYSFLVKNVRLNGLKNVISFNEALGKEKSSLFLKRSYGCGRTKVTNFNTGCKVIVSSIDDVVCETAIIPSLIKIDTEGYEIDVLEGAQSTLVKHKPKLLIASYHYPNEWKDVAKYLTKIGYDCYQYDVPLTLQKKRERYIYAFGSSK